jgi:hypothetical protein
VFSVTSSPSNFSFIVVMRGMKDRERQIHSILEEEGLLSATGDICRSDSDAECSYHRTESTQFIIKKPYLFRDLLAATYKCVN